MIDVSKLKGLTTDSRDVEEGFLFVAVPGDKNDGRNFIGQAIEKGASHVLTLPGTQEQEGLDFTFDDNPRRRLAMLAAEFYGAQPDICVAVTGTNGKTSVASFTEQLWQASGLKASSLGTLKGNLTTPDPVALHQKLSELKELSGVTHLALEASSHGLDQYRLDGVKLKAAAFTNLSRDHLDYHETMDAYFQAKSRLFSEVLEEGGVAVLNADISEFELLKNICHQRGIKVVSYGHKGSDLTLLSAEAHVKGQSVVVEYLGQAHSLNIPLVGEFQIMNALCAFALSGLEDIRLLEQLNPAPGRLQSVDGHRNAGIYVDYAHTPDALQTVLKALRPHTQNKLHVVFGCGGDRDKGKRPQMGQVASELADAVIVTDDNPRSEEPASIRADILAAAPSAQEIGDRREAISSAIQNLSSGDVLVIAGKGHETGQIFADRTDDFDDVQVTQDILLNLSKQKDV